MQRPKIILIAACDRCNAIGKDNTLPWRHRGDMANFKVTTVGNTVLMGSKTYQSMGAKPLPGRLNIVLTHRPEQFEAKEEVVFVQSIEEALSQEVRGQLYVIGGAGIYKQFLPMADRILLTRLDLEIEDPDTFFPTFDTHIQDWVISVVSYAAGQYHPDDVAMQLWTLDRRR